MSTHSSTYKGKTVRVKLRDGTVFEDKYMDTKARHIFFEERGKVSKKDVQSFSIRKLRSESEGG